MAYQGAPDGGYGQDPRYFPPYIQPAQQNQAPYNQMNTTAPRSNPPLPYQGNLAPNANFNQNAYQANSFSPVINFPSSVPSYPTPQYAPVQQTWTNTSYARPHSNASSSQPAPKRQRIEPVSGPQIQSRPAQMAYSQQPTYHSNRAQATPASAPNSTARMDQSHAQSKPLAPELQYKLLLPLAEEFFDAADNLGPEMVKSSKPEIVQSYQKLIATGLSCLESALKNRMPPREEAKVIIRYATVLYSDTMNDMEAEVALTKGITLCERNRLVDLKYQMQYLLAKVMCKTNPIAAFKSLDVHIEEARACKHYSWIYALRFLRATLSWESGIPKEAHVGMNNLHAIADLANSRNDRAVYLAAVLFQAMAHLRSGKADAVENVEMALAGARAWQFDASSQISQLLAMTHILDVSNSILKGVPSATMEKIRAMQSALDPILSGSAWEDSDDSVTIPVSANRVHPPVVTSDTRAVLSIAEDGTEQLRLSWCDKRTMTAISFLLIGVSFVQKTNREGRRRKYLAEGLKIFSGYPRRSITRNVTELLAERQWRDKILCYLHVYLAFSHASTTEWANVDKNLTNLKNLIIARHISTEGPLGMIINYITGVYRQGTGDLRGALQIFEADEFKLQKPKLIVTSADHFQQDLSLLAALNALWIHQEPSLLNPLQNSEMLEKLEPLCQNNRIQDFRTALDLIKATIVTDPPTPRLKTKNCLVEAMDIARKTLNQHFLCITLSVMSHRFFKDIVGSQAEKSSRAAAAQAASAGNKLWMSVADGVLASCLEIQQQLPEADEKRKSAITWAREALSKKEKDEPKK